MSSLKSVFEKDEAEKLAVSYTPRKFPMTVTPTAHAFHKLQSNTENPSFRIDSIVGHKTGVSELERLSLEEKVERGALARLKEVQEDAYKEAYQIGLDEGREKAFQENAKDIADHLESFKTLMASVEKLKSELMVFNEAHLVTVVYHLAKRLAMTEITTNKELVLEVLKQAIESAQSEEKITVRLAPEDFKFITDMNQKDSKDLEFERLKLIESSDITPGGCVVETGFGIIDATIEKRVEKLWAALSEKLPKVKDIVGS